jgi:hypothetical protein
LEYIAPHPGRYRWGPVSFVLLIGTIETQTMVKISIPGIGRALQIASDSGIWIVRSPFLGEAVIVNCLAKDSSRSWCAYHRVAQTGWRTLWFGNLQISHKFG